MNYNSLIFWAALLVFLPVFGSLPLRWRAGALTLFSLAVLGLADYISFILFLWITALHFTMAAYIGRYRHRSEACLLFWFGTGITVCSLFFFKIFDQQLARIGLPVSGSGANPFLSSVVPLGISFYSLQLIAYSADVFRGKVEPERSYARFLFYSGFFPQLIAGPIERASHLFPQLKKDLRLTRENLVNGSMLIAWGLFKKLIISDGVAGPVHASLDEPTVPSVGIASFLTFFWVYVDSSAYADISVGLARLFGVQLIVNFRPFIFARNVRDFWSRWHISLWLWLQDYLVRPLLERFRRPGLGTKTMIFALVMIFMGLWHDVILGWLYFGIFHWVMLVGYSLYAASRWKGASWLKPFRPLGMLLLFCGSGYFHQAANFPTLLDPIGILSSPNSLSWIAAWDVALYCLPYVALVFLVDVFIEKAGGLPQDFFYRLHWLAKVVVFCLLCSSILIFKNEEVHPFVYFAF